MSLSAVERLWVISRGDVHLSSKILGTGGRGVVQEATYKGQKVAAKTIHEDIISDHNQGHNHNQDIISDHNQVGIHTNIYMHAHTHIHTHTHYKARKM